MSDVNLSATAIQGIQDLSEQDGEVHKTGQGRRFGSPLLSSLTNEAR